MSPGNYVYVVRFPGFREVSLTNLAVGLLVTDYLIFVLQYIAYLLVRVLVEGLDDYGIFRQPAEV